MMVGYEVAAVAQSSSKIRIERATRVPTEHLERFYERMFPARASFLNRHWRWLYRIDRDRPEWSPLVATNRNEVVGHLGLIPVTLRRGRHECSAVWFVDLAVLPEHQGRDIGTALSRAAMPSCPVQLGFGNSRSMSLLEKCGWTIQEQTVALRLDLRPERHPDWRTGRRKALAAALGSIARIVSRARTTSQEEPVVSPAADLDDFTRREFGSTLHVKRSSDFLKWRITDHPHAGEYALIEQPRRTGDRCRALARVVDGQCRRLHLLSLDGEIRPETLSPFLASIVRWALGRDIHQIVYVTSNPHITRVARWWLPSVKRLTFASHANDRQAQAFLDQGDESWESLDSDFDLMYVGRG